MIHKITELQGMAFQNTLAIAAEITAAWKYSDNETNTAKLKVIGVNLNGETTIETLTLIRKVESEYIGAIFKTITAGLYTHVYIKLDTNGTNIDIQDVTFHNRIYPSPDTGSEIIQTPDSLTSK